METGKVVMPLLPRLHTFLLSDASWNHDRSRGGHLWLARNVRLQRTLLAQYQQHASALRVVAFTTYFQWEKNADGEWHATKDVKVDTAEDLIDWSSSGEFPVLEMREDEDE